MRGSPVRVALAAIADLGVIAVPEAAADPPPAYVLHKVATLESPTYLTAAPGYPTLLFVTEKSGEIRVLHNGHLLSRPFLNITPLVDSTAIEQGLLGLAFPPDYRKSGLFYVQYTDLAGNVRVDEFKRARAAIAAPDSGRHVIEAPAVDGHTNHDGGQLQFRGDLLYIGIGDGADPGDVFNLAQNLQSLHGKILRIDPRRGSGGRPYTVPRSNPFVGKPGRDEIFAYGLRNPFRFSFQTTAKGPDRILIGDVGQKTSEEIDYRTIPQARGANFGWDAWEGNHLYDCGVLCPNSGTPDPGGTTFPIFTYPHNPRCAVIGGYDVTDPTLPGLDGRYVYGDYCTGELRSFVPTLGGAKNDTPLGISLPPAGFPFPAMTSFGLDSSNHIYAASNNGPLYRLFER